MLEKAPRTVRNKGAQTKALVLETAVKVFAKKSYHMTTVEDVAKAAGLAKGTLYQYFRSKRELLGACLKLWQINMDSCLEEAKKVDPKSFETAEAFREYLSAFFLNFLETYQANSQLSRVLCKASEEGIEIESALEQNFYKLVKHFEKHFQLAKENLILHTELGVYQNAFFVTSLLHQMAYQLTFVEKKNPAQAPFKALDQFLSAALKLT